MNERAKSVATLFCALLKGASLTGESDLGPPRTQKSL